MKKQKFFHLTFVYDNFNYSFGRNVLEELIRLRFKIKIDDGDYGNPSGIRLSDMMRRQYPGVNEIHIFKIEGVPDFVTSGVNFDKYLINKIL